MVENPLTGTPPTDPIERVRAFARDLAYGAINQIWPSEIRVFVEAGGTYYFSQEGGDALQTLLTTKWQGNYPSFLLLQTFGYVTLKGDGARVFYCTPTQKAYELLEQPAVPPSVFISYGRKQSSALALYLECRLAAIGVRAFVDRMIDPGIEWHSHLQDRVRGSSYLVSLIAPGTLLSPYVREEIHWALEAGVRAISLWHSDFSFRKEELPDCPDWLEAFVTSKHAIRVQEESAEGYHDAAEKLLNRLGYVR